MSPQPLAKPKQGPTCQSKVIRPAGSLGLHPVVPERTAFAAGAKHERNPNKPITAAHRRNIADLPLARPYYGFRLGLFKEAILSGKPGLG
jgi:hypothetical protein